MTAFKGSCSPLELIFSNRGLSLWSFVFPVLSTARKQPSPRKSSLQICCPAIPFLTRMGQSFESWSSSFSSLLSAVFGSYSLSVLCIEEAVEGQGAQWVLNLKICMKSHDSSIISLRISFLLYGMLIDFLKIKLPGLILMVFFFSPNFALTLFCCTVWETSMIVCSTPFNFLRPSRVFLIF